MDKVLKQSQKENIQNVTKKTSKGVKRKRGRAARRTRTKEVDLDSPEEDILEAFEYEVSQALKATYLDSRYRKKTYYKFHVNYTSSVSIKLLEKQLKRFEFPHENFRLDSEMFCTPELFHKTAQKFQMKLEKKQQRLLLKLPKRPARFDYARLSERQRHVIDQYYILDGPTSLLNKIIQVEEKVRLSKICKTLKIEAPVICTDLPKKYSMVLHLRLSSKEANKVGQLVVPNDCSLSDLEQFVTSSFADALGYYINEGFAYFDIKEKSNEVKEAYNYWLKRLDQKQTRDKLLSHSAARFSFAISGYQMRSFEAMSFAGNYNSPNYGGRDKYNEPVKGSLLKVMESLDPLLASDENQWESLSQVEPVLSLYADPAVCDIFPKLTSTYQKSAKDIKKDIACFSFDSLEFGTTTHELNWSSSDFSVDIKFVGVQPRLKTDKDYPLFRYSAQHPEYWTALYESK